MWASVNSLQFPIVELFSQVYPVIQKTSACTVLLFQLWSLKNRKSIKRKLIETVGKCGPSTICLFWEWKSNDSEFLQHWTLQHIKFLKLRTSLPAEFLQHCTSRCAEFLQHWTSRRAEFPQHWTSRGAEFLQHWTSNLAEFLHQWTSRRAEFLHALAAKLCRISVAFNVVQRRIPAALDATPYIIFALQFVIPCQIKMKKKTALTY